MTPHPNPEARCAAGREDPTATVKRMQPGAGLVFSLLASLSLLAQTLEHSAAAQQSPNIVIILADDLGYGDISVYNRDSKIRTPNIDQLAVEGIRLTETHSPSGVCSPTRYGLLTGRYAWRTRLKRGVLNGSSPPLIESDRLTLPALLHDAGYATAAIGKWHLGRRWTLRDASQETAVENIDWEKPLLDGPNQHGFSFYFGLGKPAWTFMENDRVLAQPTLSFDLTDRPVYLMGANNNRGLKAPGFSFERMLPRFTEEAVGFIDRATPSGKPFFVYFTPMTPHRPVVPSQDFAGTSAAGLYGDFVSELDWAVGEIAGALRRNGVANNTLLILTSDNGPEVDAYRRVVEYRHWSMGPWRGVKRDLWEGGHRVPFIARWPLRIPQGASSDEVICLTDLMRTVATLLGRDLPANAGEDSYDILPVLLGKTPTQPIRQATVHHSAKGWFAIRKGDWVYIDNPTGGDNGGASAEPEWFARERRVQDHDQEAELFDIVSDPAETKNLIAERPEIAAELKALLERYGREGRSAP